ncbi:MAG TPA: serine hydrolase [Longimicrobiales bacterium]|nr:serine hydrolase [Longimicrobiales bacterium]
MIVHHLRRSSIVLAGAPSRLRRATRLHRATHLHGLLAAALLVLAAAAPCAAQSSPLQDLDAYVQRVMKDWQAPGVAVAVVKDDSVVLAKGYGVRELGKPASVTENTLFAIASTTKAFTVAALGMLVDEGELHWDDHVTDLLPGFRLYDPYVTRELTVRDLLTHRAGLPRGDNLWYMSSFNRAQVLRRVRYLKPAWSFRSHYGYQNIMFITAGQIIPALTDTTWDDFVRARIFRPLGMDNSTTTVRTLASRADVATPHGRIDGKVQPIPWPNFDNLGGAGAINSSVADMAQWLRLQLGSGVYDGHRLLSDSVIRDMRAPQTIIPMDSADHALFPSVLFEAYGLGWDLTDYRGVKLIHHGGALDGMRTQVALVPDRHLGVVVITNINESALPELIAYHIIDRYLGPRPDGGQRDWNHLFLARADSARARARRHEEEVEAARVPDTHPSLDLDAYAGTYTDSLYGTVSVTRDGDHLRIAAGHLAGPLRHWHFDTFRAIWDNPYAGKAFVTFRLDAMAHVETLEIEDWGTFRRTPPPADAAEGGDAGG